MLKVAALFCILTLIGFNAFSQLTRKTFMAGGNINYTSLSHNVENFGNSPSGFILEIKPGIGYFVLDKFATGIRANVVKNGEKSLGSSSYETSTNFNLGPFLRYYFLRTDNVINILSEFSYQYGFLSLGNTNSKNNFTISAGPVAYFNSFVGIEFLISYSTQKFTNIKGRNNTIMLGLGLQVHL